MDLSKLISQYFNILIVLEAQVITSIFKMREDKLFLN